MRLNEINLPQRTLITEGWNDPRLTLLETQHIIPFITSVERYIVEANLNPQQISQLFTNVEQGATAAGGNRTMVGKGTDAAKFINTKMKELGQAVKKSGPVQNADAKFAELKTKIGSKDSKVVSAIENVSNWAKANPGKASIAVAVLTVAASMAAGPMAGAIAGFISRASKDLLQGKDLSTAAGNAVKTAAIGAVAGAIADAVGGNVEISKPEVEGGAAEVSASVSSDDVADAAGEESENVSQALADMTADEYKLEYAKTLSKEFYDISDEMIQKIADNIQIQGDYPNNFTANLDGTVVRGNIYLTPDEAQQLSSAGFKGTDILGSDATEWIKDNVDGAEEQMDAIAAADTEAAAELKAKYDAMSPEEQKAYDDKQSQEPIYTSGFDEYTPPGEPKYKESIDFKNIQIETIIEWCDQSPAVILTEGPMDAIKKAGGAVGGALKKGAAAVGAKAAKVGKNMTTKVTADKLNSAWKKAGSPTDSDEIAKILRQQGVSDQVLAPVYKQLGAKLPPAPTADPKAAGAKPGPGGKPAAPAAAPGAKPGPGGKPAAPAAAPGAKPGPGGKPAAPGAKPAAATMDFKGIQQAVAKLTPVDAKALVTHIDSLTKSTGSQPKAATQGQTAPAAQPAQANATPTASGQAPAAKPAAAPKAGNLNSYFQNFSKAMKGASDKNQKITLAKELVNTVADRGGEDSETAVSVLRKFGGDLDNNFKQAAMNALKTGQRLLKQSVYYEINKMLKEHALSWSDLGMRVHLLEGTNKLIGISLI